MSADNVVWLKTRRKHKSYPVSRTVVDFVAPNELVLRDKLKYDVSQLIVPEYEDVSHAVTYWVDTDKSRSMLRKYIKHKGRVLKYRVV